MTQQVKYVGVAAVITLIVFAAVRSDIGREPRFDPERDSVTVRAYFKDWGGRHFDLAREDVEWQPDSATVRVRSPRATVVRARPLFPDRFGFDLIRVFSPESVWVSAGSMIPMGVPRTSSDPGPDTILLTRDVRWWSTNSYDGGTYLGLRMVPDWPEPHMKTPRARDHVVVGRVYDALSGGPCRIQTSERARGGSTAMVREAWGTASAMADSLGYFRLERVPEGWVKLNFSSLQYTFVSRLVPVPCDSVNVQMQIGWPTRFTVYEERPASAIFVPVDPQGATPPPPRPPTIVGRWRGASKCVACPLDPGCKNELGIFRFSVALESGGDGECRVEWYREGEGRSGKRSLLVPDYHLGWRSEIADRPRQLCWEFIARGDTLVGLLIDPTTRVVAREFRASRVQD